MPMDESPWRTLATYLEMRPPRENQDIGHPKSSGHLRLHPINRNPPFVLLGGGATSLKMGHYFNFGNWPAPKGKKADHDGRPHNHLLVTILHALGVDVDHFGSDDIPAGNLDDDLLGS